MSKTIALPHTGAGRVTFDFPAIRFVGLIIDNFARDLTWPKINRGQLLAAANSSSGTPTRLILPATYGQFADTHVAIPPDCPREVWSPAFFVTARHGIKGAGDWDNQFLSVAPMLLLPIIAADSPEVANLIARVMNDDPAHKVVSARDLFRSWDQLMVSSDQGDLS